MASTTKKVLIALGSLGLVGLLMFAALIAVIVIGDDKAKAKATALCGATVVGSSAEAALQRARAADSASRDPHWFEGEDGNAELLLTFPAALPLTGYMCSIKAHDGVVTDTDVYAAD
jgi:O-antigen ligase